MDIAGILVLWTTGGPPVVQGGPWTGFHARGSGRTVRLLQYLIRYLVAAGIRRSYAMPPW